MKRLFYYSTMYTSLSIVVKVISFISILWLGKTFTPIEYANFAILFSIHQGIVTFGGAGIKESIVGFFKDLKSKRERDYLFSNALLSIVPSILSSLIFFLFFFFFYVKDKNPDLILLCLLFTIISGILSSFLLFKSHMNRLKEDHFGSILYLFTPQFLIFFGGIIFVLIFGSSQYFFVGSALFLFIFSSLVFLNYRNNRLPLQYGLFTKKIIFYSFPYYIIAFTGWLKGYGNNFIINIYLDSFEIAAYSFLFTISGILLMIANSLNTVWAPRFYNTFSQDKIQNLEQKNNFFYGVLAIILGLVISLIMIIYQFILKIIGGNLLLYSGMHFELYLILLSYVIYSPIWHYRIHFYVNSMGNILMKITILSSILGILNMILFIKYFGSIGIYYGFLSSTAINLLLTSIISYRKWQLAINWFAVFIGLLISFISYFLMHVQKDLVLSILFLIASLSISTIYIFIKGRIILLKN